MIAGVIKRQGDVGRGIKEESLGRIFASGDGLAHIFQITVMNGGVEQDLTGCSVQGYFIRSADDTVLITGSAEGSVATVVLPAACYAVYGPFKLVIRVVNGSTRSTVYVGSGYVTRSSTDTIIDPGHVIPDITELLAQIDAMTRATAAAEAAATKAVRYDSVQSLQDSEKGTARNNIDAVSVAELAAVGTVLQTKSDQTRAMIAPAEASATAAAAHASGSYFTLNDLLYQATADIAAGDTITPGTNCKAVSLGGDVTDLKSAISVLEPAATAEDVGKVLIAKTVNGNKVIEYEYGETSEIDDTAGDGDTNRTWSANKLASIIGSIVPGLSDNAKIALLNCFAHVAWVDEHGQEYYDELEDALYETSRVVSIAATFNPGTDKIYTADSLEYLRRYITVTANYSDGTSGTVTSYAISGELQEGTNTLTISYGGKTATIQVTATYGFELRSEFNSTGNNSVNTGVYFEAGYDYTIASEFTFTNFTGASVDFVWGNFLNAEHAYNGLQVKNENGTNVIWGAGAGFGVIGSFYTNGDKLRVVNVLTNLSASGENGAIYLKNVTQNRNTSANRTYSTDTLTGEPIRIGKQPENSGLDGTVSKIIIERTEWSNAQITSFLEGT